MDLVYVGHAITPERHYRLFFNTFLIKEYTAKQVLGLISTL